MSEVKLTAKEQRFVEEYCKDCNATQAAIRAGYSKRSGKEIGYENLTKPHIRAAVDARLKALSLEAAETTKLIADIAKSSLNDYFTIKEVVRKPKVKKHLSEVIAELEKEIEIEEEYAAEAELSIEEYDAHYVTIQHMKREIIKLKIRLRHDPNATMVVEGPAELHKVADIDLPRLIQDKEAGRIKSVKHSEFGLNVEMYAADVALDKLARMHGLYEKDNEQSRLQPVLQAEVRIIPSEVKIAGSEKDVEL